MYWLNGTNYANVVACLKLDLIVWQVRNYEPFIVVETIGDKLSGSSGFNNVAG